MFICVNYYCTKKTALRGAVQRVGGLAMAAAQAATYAIPNEF